MTQKMLLTIFFMSFNFLVLSQDTLLVTHNTFDENAVNIGGATEFKRLFNQELVYPEKSLKEKIAGKVNLILIILANGHTAGIKVVQSVNPEIDAEAMRIARMMEWTPAIYLKTPVNSYSSLSFNFDPRKYSKICKSRGYEKTSISGPVDTSNIIFERPDQAAVYMDGNLGMMEFIRDNLVYPKQASIQNLKGKVVLGFVIEPSGRVSNIYIKESVGGGCDQEAIRILGLMKWKPARKEGLAVRSRMKLPIAFDLNNKFKDNTMHE
jgi:TonB family protein